MPRILVIDDQADVRAMIGIVLRINHFEVVEAEGAAAGLKAFEESSFDLAIVDIFLQGSNGVDLIVADARAKSGFADRRDIRNDDARLRDGIARACPTSVCLQKPFRPNELLGAIEAVCAKRPAAGGAAVA